MSIPGLNEIVETFELLDEWDERYRYLIELGRMLDPLDEADRTPETKVQGCVSQVWLAKTVRDGRLFFRGDSDAHIVKGLVAITLALYSGQTATDILARDALGLFRRLGLEEHLTPQRSNGLRSMVERIRADARHVLAEA